MCLGIANPEYRAPIQSHVVIVSGILVRRVVSYDLVQPSIPTLLVLSHLLLVYP